MLTELAKWTLIDWIAVVGGIVTMGSTIILALIAEHRKAYEEGYHAGSDQMLEIYNGLISAGSLKWTVDEDAGESDVVFPRDFAERMAEVTAMQKRAEESEEHY
jgi:hypothetical protein